MPDEECQQFVVVNVAGAEEQQLGRTLAEFKSYFEVGVLGDQRAVVLVRPGMTSDIFPPFVGVGRRLMEAKDIKFARTLLTLANKLTPEHRACPPLQSEVRSGITSECARHWTKNAGPSFRPSFRRETSWISSFKGPMS